MTASQKSTISKKPIRLIQRTPLSYKPDARCIASLFITKIYGSLMGMNAHNEIGIKCSAQDTVWDPRTTVNIRRLESVQRHAARFCLNDFSRYTSVTSMLSTLNLPSLQSRRKTAKLIILYKIINGDLHIPSNSPIPNPRDSRKRYLTSPTFGLCSGWGARCLRQ